MSEPTPAALLHEQVQHLRVLTQSLTQRALSGDRQVIDTLLIVQNQLVELSNYLAGQRVTAYATLAEAPAPMDMTPFRVPAPPLREMDVDQSEGLGQTSVSFPPAPWTLDETGFGMEEPRTGEEGL